MQGNKRTLGLPVQWKTDTAVTDLQLWLLTCFRGLIAAKGSYNINRSPYEIHLRACQCQMKHRKPERVGKLAPSPGGDKRRGSTEYIPIFTCFHYSAYGR